MKIELSYGTQKTEKL